MKKTYRYSAKRSIFAKLFLSILACGFMAMAMAQTPTVHTVTSLDDSEHTTGSLRNVISVAVDGDIIEFQQGGYYIVHNTLSVNKKLTIKGRVDNPVVISANNANNVSVFSITVAGELHLENLTVTQGNTTRGGAVHNSGKLYANNVAFSNNYASAEGGAIYNAGYAEFMNCSFYGNNARMGGAIRTEGSQLVLLNSSIVDNGVSYSVGAAALSMDGNVFMANNTITRNGHQSSSVAAVYQYDGELVLYNNIIVGNVNIGTRDYWMNKLSPLLAKYNLIGMARPLHDPTGSMVRRDAVSAQQQVVNNVFAQTAMVSGVALPVVENVVVNGVTHRVCEIDRNKISGRNGTMIGYYMDGDTRRFVYQDNIGGNYKDCYTDANQAPLIIFDNDELGASRLVFNTPPRQLGWISFGALAVQPEKPSTVVTTATDVVDRYDYIYSFREAKQYAEDYDLPNTITFNLTGVEFRDIEFSATEPPIVFTEDFVVNGTNGTSVVTFNGRGNKRLFAVQGADLTLANLCIKNGNATTGNGGAVVAVNGNLTFTNCSLLQNKAMAGNGGAVAITNGVLNMTNVALNGNRAQNGGAVALWNADELTQWSTINKASFCNNRATADGGAVYVNEGRLELRNTTCHKDTAQNGGAVYFNDGKFAIVSSTLCGNEATVGGGVFYNAGTDLTMLNNLVLNNANGDMHLLSATKGAYNRYNTKTGAGSFPIGDANNNNDTIRAQYAFVCEGTTPILRDTVIKHVHQSFFALQKDPLVVADGTKTAWRDVSGDREFAYFGGIQWFGAADGHTTSWPTLMSSYTNAVDQVDRSRLMYQDVNSFSVGAIISGRYEDTVIAEDCVFFKMNRIDGMGQDTLRASGVYDYHYTTVLGYDSIIHLVLTLYQPSPTAVLDTVVCDSYIWRQWTSSVDSSTHNGNYLEYTASIIDSVVSKNIWGCDSVEVLNLTVNYSQEHTMADTTCDSYQWVVTPGYPADAAEDTVGTYTASENLSHHTTTVDGCDSTINLNLVVNYSIREELLPTHGCDQYDWTVLSPFGGGDTRSYVGYREDFKDSITVRRHNKCDSTIVLTLTIDTTTHSYFDTVACDQWQWEQKDRNLSVVHDMTYLYDFDNAVNGNTYTVMDSVVFENAKGCDSIRTMTLTLHRASIRYANGYDYSGDTIAEECDYFDWYGTRYTTSTNNTESHLISNGNAWGCDSVVYLNLTVKENPTGIEDTTVCDQFHWSYGDGNIYSASTTTPQYTYDRDFAEGCDSTVTLHLTVNYSNTGIEDTTVCDRFYWGYGNGMAYESSTTTPQYTYHAANAFGCDSTVTLHLTVNYKNTGIDSVVACDSYTWNGITYTANNNGALDTLVNQWGCDSLVTLNLVMDYSRQVAVDYSECDFFHWDVNGMDYITDTVVSETLQTVLGGCDSVITMTLTLTGEHRRFVVDTCDNFTWSWNGVEYNISGRYGYTPSHCMFADSLILTIRHSSHYDTMAVACDSYDWFGSRTSTGTYIETIANGNVEGCDSTMTLNLTINRSTRTDTADRACDSYAWHGTTYTASGIYTDNLTTQYGCDSTVFLALTINHSSTSTADVSACDSYTWQGTTYDTAGVYQHVGTNLAGCDSTMTLNLNINHPIYRAFTQEACDSYTWHDTVYTPSGMEVNINSYTATGTYINTYTNIYGCESVDTLHLTIYNSVHSTTEPRYACYNYHWTFSDSTYTTTTTHEYHYPTYGGICDNDSTLVLHISTGSTRTYDVAACESYTWALTNTTYTESGDYVHLYNDIAGCPSVDTLRLTIHHPNSGSETRSECNSFEWNGMTFTSDTTVQTLLHNQWGCDSLATLNLVVLHSSNYAFVDSACQQYVWSNNGFNYTLTTGGTYYSHYIDQLTGCPSVDTLYLTLYNSTFTDTSVCDFLVWHGVRYTEPTYVIYNYSLTSALNCRIADTLNLREVRKSSSEEFLMRSCGNYAWQGSVYTASGVYLDTIPNTQNCDSVMRLVLTVDPIGNNATSHIACDSYTWHGVQYTTSGSYTYEYDNAYGCRSTDTLHLTVLNSSYTYDTVLACDSYLWQGTTYTTSGDYSVVYPSAIQCDSIVTLHLTIATSTSSDTVAQACETFTWYGTVYTETPTTLIEKTFPIVGECDSVVRLHLIVYHNGDSTYTANVCESYTWYTGQTYTESGIYTFSILYDGCDVKDTLNLTIRRGSFDHDTMLACDSYTWNVSHQTYHTSGDYIHNYTNQSNCPSRDTLHLVINNSESSRLDTVVCDSFLWHDSLYTQSSFGYSVYNGYTAEGCPSVDSLNLVVRYSTHNVSVSPVCGPFTWNNGQTYYTSGVYTHHYVNQFNCPSVDTLKLDIHDLERNSQTVEACEGYLWRDTLRTVSGLYAYYYFDDIGCTGYDTLYLTVKHGSFDTYSDTACDNYEWSRNGMVYNETGVYGYDYYNAVNCPSTDSLHLLIHYNSGHKEVIDECDRFMWHGITYTSSGTYYRDYSTSAGCASRDTLELTIRHSTSATDTRVVCDSLVWLDGTRYVTDNNTATFTIYNHEFCDSVITLNLTVNNSFYETQNYTACDSLLWIDNVMYWTDTMATYSLLTTAGCDSVYTMTLSLTSDGDYHDTVETCDFYMWNGTRYSTSGIYTYLPANCSRSDTLHLTINYGTNGDTVASECDYFTWYGNNYTASGIYNHALANGNQHGCDSIVVLNLTVRHSSSSDTATIACDSYLWNGTVYTASELIRSVFTNAEGCDSTVTMNLRINHSSTFDTTVSACEHFTWRGTTYIETPNDAVVDVVPNSKGCDSTIALHLTVNYNISRDTVAVACNDFTWRGMTLNETVDTSLLFSTVHGCDSLVTLHLSVNHRTDTLYNVTACDSYTWNGQTYTQSGTYVYYYDNLHNCSGTDTLVLNIKNGTYLSETLAVCDSVTWRGTTYTMSGDYLYNYENAVGCPSTDTLHLVVNGGSNLRVNMDACEYYEWHGTTYATSGEYTYAYTNATGCASVDTLHLTIRHGDDSIWHVTVCDSYTWTRNNITYTDTINTGADYNNQYGCASHDSLVLVVKHSTHDTAYANECNTYTWHGTTYTTSGNKLYTYTNAVGCPSVDTLHLTIRNSSHSDSTAVACDSFTWWRNGETYTTSGTRRYAYTNAVGCSSADTLRLTVGHSTHNVSTQSACDSYTWSRNSQTYTTSGNYTYTYTNGSNCPSADTLKLTVRHSTISDTTATACDQFTWYGATYTTSGNPTRTLVNSQNCDSVRVLHLTIHNSHPYTQTLVVCDSLRWIDGELYTSNTNTPTFMERTTHGCDSLVTLNLTVNSSIEVVLNDSICVGSVYDFGGMSYTESGQYEEHLLTVQQCDSTTILNLTVLQHPTIHFMETHSCTSFDYLLTPICSPDTRYHYTWTSNPADNMLNGQEHASFVNVKPSQATNYSVTVDYQGTVSCPSTHDTTLVKVVQPYAHMHISPDFMTYESHVITAIDQSVDHLMRKWFVDGNYYSEDPYFEYEAPLSSDSVEVLLFVSTETCNDSLKKVIPIKKSAFLIPNIFTPGEITNNIFRVQGHGILDYHIYIYNRGGLLVYESTDMTAGWDGKHDGRDCPQSAYVYMIKYTTVDIPRGAQTIKGTVMLVR